MNAGSWQPDPTGHHQLRWWDGNQWTEHVSTNGASGINPVQPTTAQFPATPAAAYGGVPSPQPAFSPPGSLPGVAAPSQSTTQRALRRNGRIAAAILAVVALGLGGFFLLRDDDSSDNATASTAASTAPATVAPATTIPAAATTTALPTSTTVAEATTTQPTTPVLAGNDLLIAAMPGVGDVPADWSRYSEPRTDLRPGSGPGYGFCGGDDAIARAVSLGSSGYIGGPTWNLPSKGWFGVTVYAFPSEAAATSFIDTTNQAANFCMTDPVVYQTTEAEVDLFDESAPDDIVWQAAEGSGGFPEPTADASQMLRLVSETYLSTTYDGVDYFTTQTYLERWERHGSVVLAFWLYGSWGDTGWNEPNPWAYQPTEGDVDIATAAIRLLIVQRLTEAGAI